MEMSLEEKLMEDIDLSEEFRQFARAAEALHNRIVERAQARGYNLEEATRAVLNQDRPGFAEVCIRTLPMTERLAAEFQLGPILTAEIALFLTARECGGMFPQVSSPDGKGQGEGVTA
jgi:hypothetical protein